MLTEVFKSSSENSDKTRLCHCSCLNSDAVAHATGQSVSDINQPCECSCTCWCEKGQANSQRNDDTSSAGQAASK